MRLTCGTIPADLTTVVAFQAATAHVVEKSKVPFFGAIANTAKEAIAAKKKRGRIEVIDAALTHWHAEKQKPLKDVEVALYGVIKECQHWLNDKQGVTKASTATRRTQVQNLRDAAWRNLKALNPALDRMERRKAQGAHGALKHLSGTYVHERAYYLHHKKVPMRGSASGLHNKMTDGLKDVAKEQAEGKFASLSEQEYFALVQQYGANNNDLTMTYLNKLARSRHLVSTDPNGLLYDAAGGLIDTGDFRNPYAMDQHENLFQMKAKLSVNHSSFLAGKEVICAGCIGITKGKLISIDNDSGHYKPTLTHLLRALHILAADGVDFKGSVVGDKSSGKLRWYKYDDLVAHMAQVQHMGILPPETAAPTWWA